MPQYGFDGGNAFGCGALCFRPKVEYLSGTRLLSVQHGNYTIHYVRDIGKASEMGLTTLVKGKDPIGKSGSDQPCI